jgi:hypothetical protein
VGLLNTTQKKTQHKRKHNTKENTTQKKTQHKRKHNTKEYTTPKKTQHKRKHNTKENTTQKKTQHKRIHNTKENTTQKKTQHPSCLFLFYPLSFSYLNSSLSIHLSTMCSIKIIIVISILFFYSV